MVLTRRFRRLAQKIAEFCITTTSLRLFLWPSTFPNALLSVGVGSSFAPPAHDQKLPLICKSLCSQSQDFL